MKFISPIRTWVIGGSIVATIFLIVPLATNFWTMKEIQYKNSSIKNVQHYFGLWKKCQQTRMYINTHKNSTKNKSLEWFVWCQDFQSDVSTPDFMATVRGFLITGCVLMFLSSLVSVVITLKSHSPLFKWIFPIVLLAFICVSIGLSLFGAYILKDYKDYHMMWSFYHCILGHVFILIVLISSAFDREQRNNKVVPLLVRSINDD